MTIPSKERIAHARKVADNPQAFERDELVEALRVLRHLAVEPTIEAIAVEAAKFADERLYGDFPPTTPDDIAESVEAYHDRYYKKLTVWGAFVQGFITARKEWKR